MSLSVTTSIPSTTSVSIPESARFIGGSDDAVMLQLIVMISTNDRFRDTIRNDVAGTARIIDALEALSERLKNFGKLVKNDWTPVTYASLSSADKSASRLKALFAADGPNLGATLAESLAELEKLKSDGVTLNAPKETPVMVETFMAVDGKVDLKGAPSAASVGWRSDQDVQGINPGTTPGAYPGSVEKTVEVRDSKNKLVSVARYTVFVDYANLRPKQEDLFAAMGTLQQNALPLLAELEAMVALVAAKKNSLDDRIRDEMNKVVDDQKIVADLKQKQADSLKESLRLLRIYRIELENFILRSEKSTQNDTGSIKTMENELNYKPDLQ